jgi:hypothetical protein
MKRETIVWFIWANFPNTPAYYRRQRLQLFAKMSNYKLIVRESVFDCLNLNVFMKLLLIQHIKTVKAIAPTDFGAPRADLAIVPKWPGGPMTGSGGGCHDWRVL